MTAIKYSDMTKAELIGLFSLTFQQNMSQVVDKISMHFKSKWLPKSDFLEKIAKPYKLDSENRAVQAAYCTYINFHMIIEKGDKVRIATEEDWTLRDEKILLNRQTQPQ